jgi:hypothetical protein
MPLAVRRSVRAAETKPHHRKPPVLPPPIPMTGLSLWLKATSGAYFQNSGLTTPATATGQPIGGWLDASGNGRHALQATAGRRPSYKKAALNGWDTIVFDGLATMLDCSNPDLAQPNTLVVVAKVNSGTGNQVVTGSADGFQNSIYFDANGFFSVFNGAITKADATNHFGVWDIFSQVANHGSTALQVRGVEVQTGSSGDDAQGPLRLGANVDVQGFLAGEIAEVMLWNRVLTGSEITQVVQYADQKFAVSGVPLVASAFLFGIFDDANVHGSSSYSTMLNDAGSNMGLNAAMLTNGNTSLADALLAVSDVHVPPIPTYIGPLAELNSNPNTPLGPIVQTLSVHPTLKGYYIRDEPSASEANQLKTWTDGFAALDSVRPAFAVLIGTDRVGPIENIVHPALLVIDVYPCAAAHPTELDFNMDGFGYPSLNMTQYIQQVTTQKPVNVPLHIILQTHNTSDAFGAVLRTPTAAEVQGQFWEAIGNGANHIWWFIYTTQQGWTGLDAATTLRAAILDLAQNSLNTTIKNILPTTMVVSAEWNATSGAKVFTLADKNVTLTGPGANRYVVVYNPTLATINTALTPVNPSDSRNLTKLIDGTTQAGVSSVTYSLPKGKGLIFSTLPGTPPTQGGVPFVPLNFGETVQDRWNAHPLNPANGTLQITSPPVVANLTSGQSIQAAHDAIDPLVGGTIMLAAGVYSGFTITKSNVHVKASSLVNKPIILSPIGSNNTDANVIFTPNARDLDYGTFNAQVDTKTEPYWSDFLNPIQNIYLYGLIFDGNNVVVRPTTATSIKRLMFDECEWQNLLDNTTGFHWGSWTSNVNNEGIFWRNCIFRGQGRWASYVDGGHGCVIVGCTITGGYGSGGHLFLTNDDFSYDINNDGVQDLNEQKSARFNVVANCHVNGFIYQFCSISGGDNLVINCTIDSTYQMIRVTGRGSNKFAPVNGLIYHHLHNMILNNTIGTVQAGPANGLQGLVEMSALDGAVNWWPLQPRVVGRCWPVHRQQQRRGGGAGRPDSGVEDRVHQSGLEGGRAEHHQRQHQQRQPAADAGG